MLGADLTFFGIFHLMNGDTHDPFAAMIGGLLFMGGVVGYYRLWRGRG